MDYKVGDSVDTTVLASMPSGNLKQVVLEKEQSGQYKSIYPANGCVLRQGNEVTLKCVKGTSFSREYPALWVIVASEVCEGCQLALGCSEYKPDYADSNNLQINKEP